MKDIYEWRPTGLTPIDYNPKKWFHLHLYEVIFLLGLWTIVVIIGSEYVIANWLPNPEIHACVKNVLAVIQLAKLKFY